MTTELETETDLEAFYRFVGELLKQGRRKMTVAESLEAYQEYRQQLQRLREEIQPALEESARGESEPLDIEQIKGEVLRSLAEKGMSA